MNAKLTIFINFAQTLEDFIMNLYVITFSPTGTSARVAKALVQGLSETGCPDIVTLDCTRAPLPAVTLGRTDLVIVAAPVYGGKMAPLAKKRMERLRGDSTPCVLLCLYGNRAFEQAPADMADMAVPGACPGGGRRLHRRALLFHTADPDSRRPSGQRRPGAGMPVRHAHSCEPAGTRAVDGGCGADARRAFLAAVHRQFPQFRG